VSEPVPASSHDELVGWFRQNDPKLWTMGLNVPLGRMSWLQLEGLAVLSKKWGDGQLRTTHEQGIAVINIPTGFKDIWTDVDGMLTADPRLVPDARVVPQLSFDEASELAYFGAKVLHPATILPAMTKNIPVRILNSRNAEARGTLITANRPATASSIRRCSTCRTGALSSIKAS
jgi:hypothetical protein